MADYRYKKNSDVYNILKCVREIIYVDDRTFSLLCMEVKEYHCIQRFFSSRTKVYEHLLPKSDADLLTLC
jgi:hypothetical protein